METNSFYIVRAMDKEKAFEVRHTDNPSIVWARADSEEEAQDTIKDVQLDWQVDQAVTDFMEKLGKELEVEPKTLRGLVLKCL